MTAPPTQPTPLDLDALELAAKAALVDRPAPWSAHEDRYRHRCLVDANQVTIVEQEAGDVDPDVLAHLVAANPATVLALVAEVRALRAGLEEACEIGQRLSDSHTCSRDEDDVRIDALRALVKP
jgi:hypothetical protein